jgi:effector-binding domain-containing protein
LPRLNRILALKDLGLSLEQIARLLNNGLSPAQLRGMLRLKQAELQQRVQEEQARLARVEARLRQIEQEGKMPTYEVVLKKVPAMTVASVRDIIPTYSSQDGLWQELGAYLARHKSTPLSPCFTMYHDTEYKERDVDAEVCEHVQGPLLDEGRVKVHQLPAVTVASVIHQGPYDGLGAAYDALAAWVEANGYRIVGPNREIYLQNVADHGITDPANLVTEVQFPVEKA